MTWLTWTLIIYYLLSGVALMPIFERAGRKRTDALIPIYNMVVASDIVGRSRSFGWWMVFPVVNFFIFSYLMIDLARSFGRNRFVDHFAATMLAPAYWTYIDKKEPKEAPPKWARTKVAEQQSKAKSGKKATARRSATVATPQPLTYYGPVMAEEKAYRDRALSAKKSGDKERYKRLMRQDPFRLGVAREWVSSIIFAVFAAGFIRMFLFEAYMIPSSSMEGNLMTGDYLIVSKIHYGLRLPETVLTMPLTHNVMPVVGGKSYIDKPQLRHRRLPKIENVDRYDKVVFNVPSGDSVYIFPDRSWSHAQYLRGEMRARQSASSNRTYADDVSSGRVELKTRPRDKRDHYVKRAVGMPGETLEIRDRRIYINGTMIEDPEGLQYNYIVRFNRVPSTKRWTEWGISEEDFSPYTDPRTGRIVPEAYRITMNDIQKQQVQEQDPQAEIKYIDHTPLQPNSRAYPHYMPLSGNWTIDNFGPIYIPAAGESIELNTENYHLYRRAIEVYEGHELEKRNGQWFIDGQQTDTYTFEQDYYWLMGDNRHNSEDARTWGFTPQDHIVGKPLLVLFSFREGTFSKGVDWSRLFKYVG
ncbi:MAG: S26 family signal peptidase [Bacteroidota bacterium]